MAQPQLGEQFSQQTADNCMLQTDGTTKYGHRFSANNYFEDILL